MGLTRTTSPPFYPQILRKTPILGQVLRTLREAYDAAPNAFGRAPVEGLGLVYERYGSQIDDQALVGALGQDRHGIHGILRRAEEYRERVGRGQPQCVAAAIVDVYNQARKGVFV